MARITDFLVPQSAALPFRFQDGQLEILLVTSNKTRRWIIPKGHIEPFITPEDSATIEAWEEAGVLGEIQGPALGFWTYEKKGIRYQVEIFPFRVDETCDKWPEKKLRNRRWAPIPEAVKDLEDEGLRRLVTTLPEFLHFQKTLPAPLVLRSNRS